MHKNYWLIESMAFCGKSQQTWHWRWDQCCIFYKNGLTQVPNSKWLSLWL